MNLNIEFADILLVICAGIFAVGFCVFLIVKTNKKPKYIKSIAEDQQISLTNKISTSKIVLIGVVFIIIMTTLLLFLYVSQMNNTFYSENKALSQQIKQLEFSAIQPDDDEIIKEIKTIFYNTNHSYYSVEKLEDDLINDKNNVIKIVNVFPYDPVRRLERYYNKDKDVTESWDILVNVDKEVSSILLDELSLIGYENLYIGIECYNNENFDVLLYSIMNGMVFYNIADDLIK